MSCGKVYIGQTGKCINERLTEHLKIKQQGKEEYKNMANHTISCGCIPEPEKTTLLGDSGRSRLGREIAEAFWIDQEKEHVISEPSIKLLKEEVQLLKMVGYQNRLRKTEMLREKEKDKDSKD